MTKRKSVTSISIACKRCGTSFAQKLKRRGRHQGFCSEECRADEASARAKRYRDEGRYERELTCANCGSLFQTSNAVCTCSRACAVAYARAEALRAHRAKRAAGDLFD